jgi:hypothetical protein
MMPEVGHEETTGKGLVITNTGDKKQILEADTIVTATPLLPNTELLECLDAIVHEFHATGDCREPRPTIDATADRSRVARVI